MKRTTGLVLAFLMFCALFCGCTTSSTQDQNYQGVPTGGQQATVPTTQGPEIINLTVNNINEYLAFRTELSDTRVVEFIDTEVCYATLTVKVTCMQNVEFKNLKVSFKMVPEASSVGYGWDRIRLQGTNDTELNPTMNIPYNGTWEESFKILSEGRSYVSQRPMLKLVVTAVSGQAIKK